MHPTRRTVLATGLALPWLPLLATDAAELSTTGEADANLAPFDQLLTTFLAENKVPGAALAISREGRLIHARGYGLADPQKKRPVQPTSLFRIASISKPITAVGVMQLVEQNKLGLDDRILDRVKIAPLPGKPLDPRWQKITLRMLLRHTAGWDRNKSGDPIGIPSEIAKAFNQPTPVTPLQVIRYTMTRPLDFDPGKGYAYSNVGYLLLGRAIEAASGMGYEAYIKKHVLAPLGIRTTQLGRALPENRAPGEVTYHDAKGQQGTCLYPPRRGEKVPIPDGVQNLEGFEAHGGWIASAIDLVRFASAFDDPKKCPLLSEKSIATLWERPEGNEKEAYYALGWNFRPQGNGRGNAWHSGLISGTSTLLVRRWDNLCWAVLFNTNSNPEGKVLSGLIDGPLHTAASQVRRWPEKDLFARYLKP